MGIATLEPQHRNSFNSRLMQSRKDADLPRWGLTYQEYFLGYQTHYNVDKMNGAGILQRLGVDHVILCANQLYWVDFILREKAYPNLFVEYDVDGEAGKFLKADQLCSHIAYSCRPHATVQLFEFDEMRDYLSKCLNKNSFETKVAKTFHNGRQYFTKGLIMPTEAVRDNLSSYRMVFVEG